MTVDAYRLPGFKRFFLENLSGPNTEALKRPIIRPIASMYGVFTYIWFFIIATSHDRFPLNGGEK